ncbi:MAG: DNA-binding protein, partial [Opitutaceae bacterium]|nr:DNA-binding protein [Opitutaceae bacterium]
MPNTTNNTANAAVTNTPAQARQQPAGDTFWTSQDGQILTVRPSANGGLTVSLTLAFWPRSPAEFDLMKARIADLHFTERSTLARIGIEMLRTSPVTIDGNRLVFDAEAFLFDHSFPNAPYWKKLLHSGAPVGRLFYAPESAKLSSTEIQDAIASNALKLPATISIDRHGSVFLTPHNVRYSLNPRLQRPEFERLVSGDAGRAYLDKVQARHETPLLTIPPRSGIITSCSMYLKEHFVLLNRGEGNFGIHTSAVLLDPIKTFGTNIMLEIYNPGDQPVVNPVVSVEIFRAPAPADTDSKSLLKKRARLLASAAELYKTLDENPPRDTIEASPRARVTVKGQNATQENYSLFLHSSRFFDHAALKTALANPAGPADATHRTVVQALDAAPAGADTLVVDYFPNLPEQIEILARLPQLKLKRLIFRHPSRTHGFFLSHNAHGRLGNFDDLGIDVDWYNGHLGDLYLHTYKKEHGFFVR